jgi:hypothetical protein
MIADVGLSNQIAHSATRAVSVLEIEIHGKSIIAFDRKS